MTLKRYIQKYKAEIDSYIRSVVPPGIAIDNDEREMWIMNDEYLYRLAKSAKVEGI